MRSRSSTGLPRRRRTAAQSVWKCGPGSHQAGRNRRCAPPEGEAGRVPGRSVAARHDPYRPPCMAVYSSGVREIRRPSSHSSCPPARSIATTASSSKSLSAPFPLGGHDRPGVPIARAYRVSRHRPLPRRHPARVEPSFETAEIAGPRDDLLPGKAALFEAEGPEAVEVEHLRNERLPRLVGEPRDAGRDLQPPPLGVRRSHRERVGSQEEEAVRGRRGGESRPGRRTRRRTPARERSRPGRPRTPRIRARPPPPPGRRSVPPRPSPSARTPAGDGQGRPPRRSEQ